MKQSGFLTISANPEEPRLLARESAVSGARNRKEQETMAEDKKKYLVVNLKSQDETFSPEIDFILLPLPLEVFPRKVHETLKEQYENLWGIVTHPYGALVAERHRLEKRVGDEVWNGSIIELTDEETESLTEEHFLDFCLYHHSTTSFYVEAFVKYIEPSMITDSIATETDKYPVKEIEQKCLAKPAGST